MGLVVWAFVFGVAAGSLTTPAPGDHLSGAVGPGPAAARTTFWPRTF